MSRTKTLAVIEFEDGPITLVFRRNHVVAIDPEYPDAIASPFLGSIAKARTFIAENYSGEGLGLRFVDSNLAPVAERVDPLFGARYTGSAQGALVPGCLVDVYPLAAQERESADVHADFKVLVSESGEGFFYALSDELEVFSEDILAA
jgi:hypothetical protein